MCLSDKPAVKLYPNFTVILLIYKYCSILKIYIGETIVSYKNTSVIILTIR